MPQSLLRVYFCLLNQLSKHSTQEMGTPDICILGAGFAGLTVGLQIRRTLKWKTFTIYEKNDDIGGAWLANVYPGSECDFPSHFYSWSFEPNPDWSRNFASQSEILSYMKIVARKYELYDHLKLKTEVESVTWNEATNKWTVIAKEENGMKEERNFDFVFSGINSLWQPNKPKSFENFAGPCFHTAEWDNSVDLEGKVVGVVGTGSSAVQLIPAIAPKVKTLHSFQRQTAWVMPKEIYEYSAFKKWAFRNIPFVLKWHRWSHFWKFNDLAKAGVYRSKANKQVTEMATNFIKEQTKAKPELWKRLVPNYDFGCKVISFSSTYFPALASDKVTVHFNGISEVTRTGVVANGEQETPLDVLILATGFKSQEIFGPMKMIGLNGQDVLEIWKKDRPRNFIALCSTLAPNLFFIGGPLGLLAITTAIFMIETQTNYALKILKRMVTERKKFVLVKKEAEDAYMTDIDKSLSANVIPNNPSAKSWVSNNEGKLFAIATFSAFEYWRKARTFDSSKFIFK